MNKLEYVKFDNINADDFIPFLNNPRIREHLIKHDLFDSASVRLWIEEKIKVNNINGCKVRGIYSNNTLAGWCAIQYEKGQYEIAIVLDDTFWGLGKTIFNDIMLWAKTLGHNEVFIHLLHTRPEYKFLRKISKDIFVTELMGNKFTTYQLTVN